MRHFGRAGMAAALSAALWLWPAPGGTEGLEPAGASRWPAIGRLSVGGLAARGFCTGTLVAPDLVLSAAHCLRGVDDPERLSFAPGWIAGRAPATLRGAEIIRTDGPGGSGDDIVLIRLARPVPAELARPYPLAPPPRGDGPLAIIGYSHARPDAPEARDDCYPIARQGVLLGLSCPVVAGNSGAPVLVRHDGGWHVVAVIRSRFAVMERAAAIAVIPPESFRRRAAGRD
ncbi:hypothetical protein DDZ14_01730 [Maritimibacter sp. 55A14]|uniref:trypsin-like serine peptidase n=1 Tax=Maritimibacter sp. 55A14 TaxID=2174844 RepID=UPI000D608E50|nr:trypsin-like serine protease [Maritimibacter sp. 55A14]PWE33914.1 hypothetical protein DDZ14_01730 [Maritimibacter sp. 55A14]